MKPTTGSHTGTGSWLLQRATAVVLALALPVLMVCFLAALPLDFTGWRTLFAPPWLRVLMLLTVAALALHAWVGMRDIFMDYVHHTGLRLLLVLAVIVTLAGSVVWLAVILFATTLWGTT
ncbi:MAG: succinate dehydrogenase, hydrophobic membrane anchor protein [Thiobacillus sp.]|nr:succinate dehydrogenase, hydrophobic membrane anchor protein [Thiobacillus sp.]